MSQVDAARIKALDRQGDVGKPRKPTEDKPEKPRTVGYQRPDMGPYFMPPIKVGMIVNYVRGYYQPHVIPSAAVVVSVQTRSVGLAIIEAGAVTIKPTVTGVRHKDDPEVRRLAMLNRDAEDGEKEEFGVWFHSDNYLTPDELKVFRGLTAEDIDGLKLLVECYGDEIAAARAARDAQVNGAGK